MPCPYVFALPRPHMFALPPSVDEARRGIVD